MRLIDRTIAYPEGPEGAAYELAGYLTADTLDMIRVRTLEVRSDIYDHCTISFSADNGRTWSESQPYPVRRETPEGVYRQSFGNTFVDPVNGRLLVTASQTFLPTDQMLEALIHSTLTYRVSEDGGRSWLFDEPVVQHGDAYSTEYPIEGVWTGKNVAHVANEMVFSSDGRLVLPLQRTCLQEDGTLFCPPGALSYHDLIMLIGAWQDDGRIRWTAGQPVTLPPEISTRGVTEGAVAEMPDGRFLMVMRTSNAGNLKLPGHKWYCVSHDGGDTWDTPRPWGYTDGSLFFSPASYSTIARHSSGGYYWFGNISPYNPEGNLPRHPLVAGLIDPDSLLLRRDTVMVVDTRRGDEVPPLLGNFQVYEERGTGHLIVRSTRLWVEQQGERRAYRGHACLYRIEP